MAGSEGSRNWGPRPLMAPTVSLVRQAVSTSHSCKTYIALHS